MRCASSACVKKTTRYAGRNQEERISYLRELRELLPKFGGIKNVVYVDEGGFEAHSNRTRGWAKRGEKIFGDVPSRNRKATNLIMAQRQKDWLAPMTFTHSCGNLAVIARMRQALLPELTKPSIIVMDNAPFHLKEKLRSIAKKQAITCSFSRATHPTSTPLSGPSPPSKNDASSHKKERQSSNS